ncbi:MAG: DUF2510 domain-containing protein [Ilumatobacteraceae bacterium]
MNPPPGWYPDPAEPGARYWDDGRWTEDAQAAESIGQGPGADRPGTDAGRPDLRRSARTPEPPGDGGGDRATLDRAPAEVKSGGRRVPPQPHRSPFSPPDPARPPRRRDER